MSYRVLGGDCVARLNMLDEESIDNCITDPPYEIGFMGQGWDNTGVAYNPATWRAVHRVLKPNGYMLVFGATKTHHRIADAIQRAGFEIVDIIAWCYGTGFPKSHNIGKAVDKLEGNEREVVGVSKNDRPNSQVKGGRGFDSAFNKGQEHQPIIETKGQSQWEGWGTALKPAWEPIIVARKKGSQRNVDYSQFYYIPKPSKSEKNAGLEAFEDKVSNPIYGNRVCSSCGKNELQSSSKGLSRRCFCENPVWGNARIKPTKNTHPTVKPVKLMKKLVEEFTEEGSTVLDPFTGSGTTGMASVISDRDFIGCELTSEYIPLAKARIGFAQENKSFFD
jgi:site-specific DNA-methyltransferase (adenine-specific)